MNTDDLRKYREMQFDGTLEKFAQCEYEARQYLLRHAYPMREFERRAALVGCSQPSRGVVVVAEALAYRLRIQAEL